MIEGVYILLFMIYFVFGMGVMVSYYDYDMSGLNGLKVLIFSPIWIMFLFFNKSKFRWGFAKEEEVQE